MKTDETKCSILIVDDSPDTLELIQRNLASQGYGAFTAQSASAAIDILEATPIDLVISDLKMPGINGLDLIRHIKSNFRETEVMIISGYATVESAVESMRLGALDFLSKPFTDEELYEHVASAMDKIREHRNSAMSNAERVCKYSGIMGNSKPMRKVFKTIEKASLTPATVLISGESGTGKELVARAIHYNSSRASSPFVPVNCGGIPETLIESELFGYVKGAFTGATESRAGFFQTADGGSIFLDEISDTSLTMQSKILRVLQEKEVCMVGSSKRRSVNVRIIAATNKDLRGMIEKGSFRADLFYRLNVIAIDLPALRERDDDIAMLVRHFSRTFAEEMGKPIPAFTDEAMQILLHYHWPGNVRELQNIIHRLVVMSDDDVIESPELPSLMRFSLTKDKRLHRSLAEVEAEHIRNVLVSVNENKSMAAKILGIDRKTLRKKLEGFSTDS